MLTGIQIPALPFAYDVTSFLSPSPRLQAKEGQAKAVGVMVLCGPHAYPSTHQCQHPCLTQASQLLSLSPYSKNDSKQSGAQISPLPFS